MRSDHGLDLDESVNLIFFKRLSGIMAPPAFAIILFIWVAICYIVGLVAPWTYLSFKNAYGENLGITDEGMSVIPPAIQNMTCSRVKADVYVWKGVCNAGSCTGFENRNAWEGVDLLNADYSKYYKHAIATDFAGDESKWNVVQSLVVMSLVVLLICLIIYIYGTTCNEGCREDTTSYISLGLVLTSAASIAAVVVSLNTYALDHQFYTGGAYYVQGWFVYSAFSHGCEGPQYVPGPGIVMHPFGALTALLLALILPCQCMAPYIPEQDVYTPLPQAAAVAYLDDSVVVYDEAA